MALTMGFFESCQMAIHAVFACHLRTFRKVVYLLVSSQSLVSLTLDVGASPRYLPFLVAIRNFPETVVFESIAYQRHIYSVVELEEVASILWLVRSQCHRVNKRSED